MELKDINDTSIQQTIGRASAPLLWSLANELKARRHIALCLDIVELLLTRQESFVYARYGDIMLLKAVLLSDDRFKRWDEAIHLLRILDESIGYSQRNIEVITLLGSNYKRKALYDANGTLKETITPDIKNDLTNALGYYNDAYRLRPQGERYYDLVNIFYLEKMTACASKDFDQSSVEAGLKHRLDDLAWDSDIDRCSWWEFISYCELHILAGIDKPADWIAYSTLVPTADEFAISKRQMDIYRHFCPNDELFNDFYDLFCNEFSPSAVKGSNSPLHDSTFAS